MADVTEGLGTPDAGEEVNSDHGFEAAMAAKVGKTEEFEGREPTLSTSIAEGLIEAGAGASAIEEPEVEEVEEDDLEEQEEQEEPEEESAPDPWQVRYEEAQKVIGRQGNELGQERQARQALEQRFAAYEARSAPSSQLSGEQVQEVADDMIVEHGEVQAALSALNQDPSERLYKAVMRSWAMEDPIAAQDFNLEYREAKRGASQPQGPTTDPWVEGQKQAASITAAFSQVKEEAKDWDTIESFMLPALEEVPQRVASMVGSRDPEERLDGVRIVADRARLLSNGSTASVKAKQAEVSKAKKKSATVVSGSMRPVATPTATGANMTSEERQAEFKKQLMAQETTSVHEGLTYAK